MPLKRKSGHIFIPRFLTTVGLTTAVAAGTVGAVGVTATTWVPVPTARGGCELATDRGIMPPPLLLLRARP